MSDEPQNYIFIVDDDSSMRESITALLQPCSAQIVTFDSGEAFLEGYQGQRPACLVTDQRMPGIGGVQMLETLQERGDRMSIVVITAFADTRSTVRAMKSGAMNLIEKPFNPQELWDAVQEGLRLDALALEKETKRAACQDLIDNLTESEHRVMLLLSDGNANKVIASRLGVSLRTVEGRRASIFQKLHVDSIAGMMTVYLATKDE